MSGENISMFELVICLSDLIDLVNPILAGHHRRVAYIAHCISRGIGMPVADQNDTVLAALLHDAGALSLGERLDAFTFEDEASCEHAEKGYRLLKDFSLFKRAAEIVRYHHSHWNSGETGQHNGAPVPVSSHIIHLADKIDVLMDKNRPILAQVKFIYDTIRQNAGRVFNPRLVEAFIDLSSEEAFWFDIVHFSSLTPVSSFMPELVSFLDKSINSEELLEIALLIERIIDFRSRFTATHSSGVAATAQAVAQLACLSDSECRALKIAGHLHDIGKLAVPAEILEKPGRLTDEEISVIKGHTYYSYNILSKVHGLESINEWVSYHHEKLDGRGYPFRLKGSELSLGSRIMAVADIFTAITEDRPYRKGMSENSVKQVLGSMSRAGEIDGSIVEILLDNYASIDHIRAGAQLKAAEEYSLFLA